MAQIIRIVYALLLLAVAAFSVFGFLATFEPSDHNILVWRVGYAAVGIGAIVAAAWFLRPRKEGK